MLDVLIAGPKRSTRLSHLDSSWRPRTATFESLLKGQSLPAQITIIDIDRPGQLPQVEALAEMFRQHNDLIDPNFVVLSFKAPESKEEKVRLLEAFARPEWVEISEDPGRVAHLLENLAAKIEAISRQKPRPSPLDKVKSLVSATGSLRESSGNLSAIRVAELYSVSVAQLAEWLGRSRQSVMRTPDADSLQDSLSYFERIARLASVLSEEEFRKWLRMPNPNLGNACPLKWIEEKRWQALADFVDDMLTGAPN